MLAVKKEQSNYFRYQALPEELDAWHGMAKANFESERELAAIVNDWVSGYVKDVPAGTFLSGRTTELDESYAEGGELFFTPNADGLKSGKLTFPVNIDRDEPGSLRLVLESEAHLTLAALGELWGMFKRGTQAPGQEQAVFELRDYHHDEADYVVDIVVTVSDEEMSGSPLVCKIDVLRISRITPK